MIKKSLLTILFTLSSIFLYSQNTFSGKFIDADTKAPISCAKIYIEGLYSCNYYETTVYTNQDGVFTIPKASEYYTYSIEFYHDDYHEWSIDTLMSKSDIYLEIELYSYDSPNYRVLDVAGSDRFDMGYGFDFFSPIIQSNDNLYAYNLTYEALVYEGRIKLGNRSQLGFKGNMLDLNWVKFKTLSNNFEKENYFSASIAFFAYYRWIASLNDIGNSGLFFDVGAGYRLPYYYSLKQHVDDTHVNVTRKINRYNDYELMFRVGYSQFALKATYRITDNLKNSFVQPPRLSLGFELMIPSD